MYSRGSPSTVISKRPLSGGVAPQPADPSEGLPGGVPVSVSSSVVAPAGSLLVASLVADVSVVGAAGGLGAGGGGLPVGGTFGVGAGGWVPGAGGVGAGGGGVALVEVVPGELVTSVVVASDGLEELPGGC